ncbi:ABC transporter permease [Azospirillum sp. SYSU D00513]|uniref:ABC transporter permease n=1 Tax=Azospirillum sp. SYSU D00513 TaxID=2812561 RepID=UPI001A95BC6C|nr:ABC transporter permease [Azospirillum sp. SYSU D00513]
MVGTTAWQTVAWQRALSFLSLVTVWQIAAAVASSRLLPSPWTVLEVIIDAALQGELFLHLGATLARVSIAFVLSMVIGAAIGIALGRSALLDRLFDGWLLFFLNMPALVIIILAYVWFGLSEAAALLAVAVNKIPNVAVVMREGARTIDRDLLEMARVYRFGPSRTLRHLVLPQLLPYFLAAARSGLALIWKIVLVVELLGRSSGVGFQLHVYFQMFDVASILAYALAFIAVVAFVEWTVFQPIERRSRRWRR